MNISPESNIGKMVAENYKFASVFKAAGIDFCCNGNRTIADACEKKKLNCDDLLKKLTAVSQNGNQGSSIDFRSWPLDLLADYIEKTHHRYVEQKIEEITPFLSKIVQVHGRNHPELAQIETLFHQGAEALTSHMSKEEGILFPFIRQMVNSNLKGEEVPSAPFGSVNNPIAMMHEEHDAEGERFREISLLSNNYTPPEDACSTYRVTFAMLEEFEDDLHKHIHLENNILFPKSIELEKELRPVN